MSRSTPTDPAAALAALLAEPPRPTPSSRGEDSDFTPPDDWRDHDPDPDGYEADAAADRYERSLDDHW